MTKKSQARLIRDEQKKQLEKASKEMAKNQQNNKCWDELNQMHNSMLQMLFAHTNISVLGENKNLIAQIDDKVTLVKTIKSLTNDIKVLNDELAEIKKSHENKTGGSSDPDEIMQSFVIFEHYNLWLERHNAVVMPTAYHIIELFNQAEQKLAAIAMAAKAEQDLKDPNVISDAIIVTKDADTVKGDDWDGSLRVAPNPPDFTKLAESFKTLHHDIPSDTNVVQEEKDGE